MFIYALVGAHRKHACISLDLLVGISLSEINLNLPIPTSTYICVDRFILTCADLLPTYLPASTDLHQIIYLPTYLRTYLPASTANGYPYMKEDNIHEIRFMQDTRHTKRLKHENHMFPMKDKNLTFRGFKTIHPNMDINMMLSRPMPLKCHFHVSVRYSCR